MQPEVEVKNKMNIKNIVVLTGAGMSAESGIPTFRASDGLWENHKIEDVATPLAFAKNPELVLNFYNQRRRHIATALPNSGHKLLAEMQKKYHVQIITQNIDDLHERAGSEHIVHLHGQITMAKSSIVDEYYQNINYQDINIGDKAKDGSQLRPHIVWFGEPVPLLDKAIEITSMANIFVVIGTSLQVYPAASLVQYAPKNAQIFVIDPFKPTFKFKDNIQFILKGASEGLQELCLILENLV